MLMQIWLHSILFWHGFDFLFVNLIIYCFLVDVFSSWTSIILYLHYFYLKIWIAFRFYEMNCVLMHIKFSLAFIKTSPLFFYVLHVFFTWFSLERIYGVKTEFGVLFNKISQIAYVKVGKVRKKWRKIEKY